MNRIAPRLLAIAVMGWGGTAAQPGTVLSGEALPLARTVLVTDIDALPEEDEPGTGGGFEIATYFQNKLTSPETLVACVADVERAVTGWATGLGLGRALREAGPTSLMLHYGKSDLAGIFTVSYEVNRGIRARVAVDFYGLDGTRRPPEYAMELNETFLVAELQDLLDEAMACQAGANP